MPLPAHRTDLHRCGSRNLGFGCRRRYSLGQSVFAAGLDRGGTGQQTHAIAVDRLGQKQLWSTLGQRSGFVESNDVDLVRQFQRLSILDQNAVTRGHAGAGHDGRRCCQSQRTGAGDHQNGDSVQQRLLPVSCTEAPAQYGEQGDAQHPGHEDRTDPIDQVLNRGLLGLRRLNQAHDARQRRFGTNGRRSHQQQPLGVDGAAGDLVPRALGHGQAFAGNERFVHLALAFDDDAVHRNPLTRVNDHHVPDADQCDAALRYRYPRRRDTGNLGRQAFSARIASVVWRLAVPQATCPAAPA